MKRLILLLYALTLLCACSKEKSEASQMDKKSIEGKWYSIHNPNELIYDITKVDEQKYSVKTSKGAKEITIEKLENDTVFTTISGIPNKFYVDNEGTMINYLKKPYGGYFITKYRRNEP